jgi:tight adherence protein C
MDLLVVCADAGLAMEAALERVARELSDTHRSLATNIHIANWKFAPAAPSPMRLSIW